MEGTSKVDVKQVIEILWESRDKVTIEENSSRIDQDV